MSSSNPSFFLYTWIMAPMGTSLSYAHLKFQAPIPSFFLYTWIMAPMGTSSSYAHLKFQAPIPSLITLGFWLQWAPRNFFKLYTLEAFSLRHNEILLSFQDLSNTTQALMNTKVHSKICKCNECTHKLSLRTNTQEKRSLRASLLFYK